jgi:Na+/proline symporter
MLESLGVSQNDQSVLMKIMFFYAILSFVIGPLGGLYLKKNKEGLLWGMITGCVVSILLWQQYGEKMISLQ